MKTAAKTAATLILGIVPLFLFFSQTATAISPQEIIENVQEKYADIKDASLRFTQSVRFKAAKAEQTIEGRMLFKKKNKYRIETDQRTIVTDGINSWSYSPQNNQLIVDSYKEETHSLAPERLLLAYPEDYYSTVIGDETVEGETCYVLKLTPKDENSFTTGMKIWISRKWFIKKVEITDLNSAVTAYVIKELKTDTSIPDSKFSFAIPPGADVIDLRK